VLLAGDGSVLKIARRIWEVGVTGCPVTGHRWGGVLNITASAWTAGFHWWRSGNITRTHNVSEYMLLLAVGLVLVVTRLLHSNIVMNNTESFMRRY